MVHHKAQYRNCVCVIIYLQTALSKVQELCARQSRRDVSVWYYSRKKLNLAQCRSCLRVMWGRVEELCLWFRNRFVAHHRARLCLYDLYDACGRCTSAWSQTLWEICETGLGNYVVECGEASFLSPISCNPWQGLIPSWSRLLSVADLEADEIQIISWTNSFWLHAEYLLWGFEPFCGKMMFVSSW